MMRNRSYGYAAALVGAAASLLLGLPVFAQSPAPSSPASASASVSASGSASGTATTPPPARPTAAPLTGTVLKCQEQRAQPFLIRGNWFNNGAAGREMFQKSLRYRTEKYGYFAGFGRPEWNANAPRHYAVMTKFMGHTIQVNKRIVPALQCVEKALMEGPAHMAYHPHGIGGIRFHNTYYGGEVSNHVYGIAIDIDSDTNTCCGCVGNWAKHPQCMRKVDSIYERMAMPKSWVDTFERYGFYWLGHDVLQDTMHFEFLGDPDKILL